MMRVDVWLQKHCRDYRLTVGSREDQTWLKEQGKEVMKKSLVTQNTFNKCYHILSLIHQH